MTIGTTWNRTSTAAAGAIRSSMKRSFSPKALRRRRAGAAAADTSSSRAGIAIRLLHDRHLVEALHAVLEHLGNGFPRAGERLDRHVRIGFMQLRPIGEIIRR